MKKFIRKFTTIPIKYGLNPYNVARAYDMYSNLVNTENRMEFQVI